MDIMTDTETGVESETAIWTGRPSQLINLPIFIVCLLLFWLVFPIFVALWRYLEIRAIRYDLTTQRLYFASGVFNRDRDQLELYRIKDYHVGKPFLLRIFGLGDVVIMTSDQTTPTLRLRALHRTDTLADRLRDQVEIRRDRKRVSEVDFE